MERPHTEGKWKAMLNKAVEEHHMTKWYKVEDKTSLKYLTLQKHPTRNSHPIWYTVPNNTRAIMKANIKAKIITGTYTLLIKQTVQDLTNTQSHLHAYYVKTTVRTENT